MSISITLGLIANSRTRLLSVFADVELIYVSLESVADPDLRWKIAVREGMSFEVEELCGPYEQRVRWISV